MIGSFRFWLPPLPNSKTRCRATGMLDRSGFGINDGRHLALIGLGRITHDAELQELADAGIGGLPGKRLRQREILRPVFLPSWCSHRFTIQHFVADAVSGEVNHDVISFGDALLIQLRERHRAGQQVAIVGDLDHRLQYRLASRRPILKKRDTLAFRMRKRYLRRSTSKYGL